MSLQSPLKKARGLGSAKNGTHHWWMQRVTAIALIPLVIWFVSIIICANMGSDTILDKLESPYNAVLMIVFLCTGLYHGTLGVQVIFEDYVHCPCGRNIMNLATKFFAAITAVALVLAVAQVHIDGARTKREHVQIDSQKHEMWKNEFFKVFNSEQ